MLHESCVQSRSFHGATGGTEAFIAIATPATGSFGEQLGLLRDTYLNEQQRLGLPSNSAIFQKLFCSDILNQAGALRDGPFAGDMAALSVVQQPPLPGGKLALVAHHVMDGGPLRKRRLSPRHLLVTKRNNRHLYSTRLCCGDHDATLSAAAQTGAIFGELMQTLRAQGGTLRDHCVRTWIFMKDVDVFYEGMVQSRRALFAEAGLTPQTHTIASTGIEGACAHRHDLVAMDAYSNLDLRQDQVRYLNDPGRLCPATAYAVTFERGTRIAYADRAHLFLSGTASIDAAGEIVHPGDVVRQLDRALTNAEGLLESGQGTLNDLMYLIVYLRDAADFAVVNAHLRRRLPGLPAVTVQAPVCRPGWLVEIEGIAITKNHAPDLPSF
jgi:enamine deaminase RidA (YjgF/YER057c/UK114 family)